MGIETNSATGGLDKAAFGYQGDFGQAHQALLKALDRAPDFIKIEERWCSREPEVKMASQMDLR